MAILVVIMKNVNWKLIVVLVSLNLLCEQVASADTVYSREKLVGMEWTQEEQDKNIAIKHLKRTDTISAHLVRVKGQEPPHVHDKHDLIVTVISGQSVLHLADKTVSLNPGDVVLISKGEFHWVENVGADASLAHVVFTPPFDGKDRRIVELKPESSSP